MTFAGQYPGIGYAQGAEFNFWITSSSDLLSGLGTQTFTNVLKLNANGNATFGGTVKVQNGGTMRSGTGSPNSAVTGSVGDIFLRTDGGTTTTMYVKESGNNTTTGWVAK
jgi:hypothetical protein